MTIEIVCSNKLEKEKFILRNLEANLIGIGMGGLIQYKSNPSGKGLIMFYTLEGTDKFNIFIKKYGEVTNYAINAKDGEGNTLNTFHFLA